MQKKNAKHKNMHLKKYFSIVAVLIVIKMCSKLGGHFVLIRVRFDEIRFGSCEGGYGSRDVLRAGRQPVRLVMIQNH